MPSAGQLHLEERRKNLCDLQKLAVGPFLPQGVFYSSSSSSILGFVSVGLVGVVVGGWLPEMTESRAALMFCVAVYLSGLADWSMLGRCRFRGLPTRDSAGTSLGAKDDVPGVAVVIAVVVLS